MKSKRSISLLLCLVMLLSLTTAFADVGSGSIVPNTGDAALGSIPGGGSSSTWANCPEPITNNHGAGMYLNVVPASSDITATGYEKNMADILKSCILTYPETTWKSGLYILPSYASNPQILDGNASQLQSASMPNYKYMEAYSGTIANHIGEDAYNTATASSANVKPKLGKGYWSSVIGGSSYPGCEFILAQMYSTDYCNGIYDRQTSGNVNKAVQYYLDYNVDTRPKGMRQVAQFINYCGYLATVIKCLPGSVGDANTPKGSLTNQLESMYQSWQAGNPYKPLLVVGEVIYPTHINDSPKDNYWWRPRLALEASTGVGFKEGVLSTVKSAALQHIWSNRQLMKANTEYYVGYQHYGDPTTATGTNFTAREWTCGSKKAYGPVVATLFSSVSDAVLERFELKEGVTPYKALEGVGYWGLNPEIFSPPNDPPATGGSFIPVGSVGLQVEPKIVEKAKGDYTQTFNLTVTVNLSASGEDSAGNSITSFATGLRWLADKADEGVSVGKPTVEVFLKQAEAKAAISGDAASALIKNTSGYCGDGVQPYVTSAGVALNPASAEAAAGGFTWKDCATALTLKDPGIKGMHTEPGANNSVLLVVDNLRDAANYLSDTSGVLTFTGECAGSGKLASDTSKNQHWFKVGSNVITYGPKSASQMSTLVNNKASLSCEPKYDYATITAGPSEKPYYYSTYQQPFSEFKQGTVPTSGGGSSETFNSMTGTPTFTYADQRSDLDGTIYEDNGHYYQYFASGGSEFVVQFDGEYVESATASRTYSATFTGVHCHLYHTQAHIPCPGHPSKTGTTYCAHHGCPTHATCTENHTVGDTFTWSQAVNGFSYVKITNLKVWKLSEAKLDGTRELLNTDEVTATVQATAPTVFYNIAASNNSASGRLVYTYNPAQNDSAVINGYPKASDNNCTAHRANNQKTLDADTASMVCGATCISDFIVLRTTNGDQSILYYEYKSKKEARINTGNCVAEPIEFDKVPYATIWTGNSQTSKGSGLPNDGITYGGYNGNYSNMSGKYQSTGHAQNISLEGTTAYKNASGRFKPTTKPTQKLRLLNDQLIIPDTKQNGEYILGNSKVFYENIINFGSGTANFPIVSQPDFGGRRGFVIQTTYSPGHDKINDVVVYNPVSNQNAMLISLPTARDQRVKVSDTGAVAKTEVCPGDASCPYLKNQCTCTQHVHTEDCYTKISYDVKPPFTTHVHDASCPYHMTSMQWYHTSGCTYEGQTHTTTSTSYCTTCGHSCGYLLSTGGTKVYDCGNLPLNAYAPDGAMKSGDTKTYSYTGGMQQVTLAPGTYKLECYGAQGGGTGGAGGYSAGTLTLTTTTTLYVGVGGQNATFNGGGSGFDYSGGGATHIATATNQLSALSSNTSAVLLVAGGGGAGGPTSGGAGGGANAAGAIGQQRYGSPGGGGTLSSGGAAGSSGGGCTSAGSFGQGGTSSCNLGNHGNSECGGGGGYYGGGGGGHDCGGYNDNDDSGGGGGSGYASSTLSSVTGSSGTNSGNGKAVITAVSVTSSQKGYTVYKSVLSCSDPHHAYSYNWKLYTYGLMHKDGTICTGRNCTDKTDLIFPTQEVYTQAQCAAGYIVKHANGDVHLSTTNNGTCSYCGNSYKTLLSAAQTTDRTPDPSEYTCYEYGDARCWAPCGNPANHQKYVTDIVDNGVTYTMGKFINLDWPFQVYFPNTGDFYGTGAAWSSTTTAERGKGYTNNMDTTEWVKTKWIEFPFAVLYAGATYKAYERIYLSVPQTVFDFYVPLQDSEAAQAEIKYGTVAINAQNGETLECGTNRDHNIQAISYMGKPDAHHHNADKRSYIDVVGRIGALTLEDTGDFRFSNLFKQATSGWIVNNVVHKVDFTKPNYVFSDQVDVRGVSVTGTGTGGNTYGSKVERNDPSRLLTLPISPAKNNVTALQRQPLRVGYDCYFDLTTLGNYYGATLKDEGGNVTGQQLILVKPHYYRLDLESGYYKPVDVYMDVNGNKVLINDFDSNTVSYFGADANVSLNWRDEAARRNFSGYETNYTNNVKSSYSWVETPYSSSWTYGNYNILNLTQRNRTFIGSEFTYGWDKDPSDKLPNVGASLQGARWHFNVGLPSSACFVYSGQEASDANIDACASGSCVVFCALEIYAQGDLWTLGYDGSNVNKPFRIVAGGPQYDPVIPYPTDRSPKGEEQPIVAVFSINKSSKDDLNVTGTH